MQQKKLLSLIRQAIKDYNMIDEGDRIAVGVSGGKDSLTLLYAMKLIQSFILSILNYMQLHVMSDLMVWILQVLENIVRVLVYHMNR